MKNKKALFIIHFTFYILLILTISNCSDTTEVSKGSLSGTVNLEDETDHSGITVALYDLATLDPDIVSINQEYPHIGVIINQHTEFDHRLQEPVKYTETDAEGYFKIKKIPTGKYNVVAIKDSFGFKYIYEFEIEEGENTLTELTPRSPLFNSIEGKVKNNNREIPILSVRRSLGVGGKGELKGIKDNRLSEELSQRHSTKSLYRTDADIVLYPETHISGNISGSVTVETNHHLVIDDDTVFVPNTSTLIIQPGAVIRINPGIDLTIYGTLTAQGEENNMFWVTSNDGFNSFPAKLDSVNFFNSIVINCLSIDNDKIIWGKIEWFTLGVYNEYENLSFEYNIIKYGVNGICNIADNLLYKNVNCYNISNRTNTIYNLSEIRENIFVNNYENLLLFQCQTYVHNNYFANNYIGCQPFYGENTIMNNCFINNELDIAPCASNPVIKFNDFYTSEFNIELNRYFNGIGFDYCNSNIQINNNNFYNEKIIISIFGLHSLYGVGNGLAVNSDIYLYNNFWLYNDYEEHIIDVIDDPDFNFKVYYYPSTTVNSNAGIQ